MSGRVLAGHDRGELGGVVGRLDHVKLYVGVQLAVDLLPGGVLVLWGGGRVEAVAQRVTTLPSPGGALVQDLMGLTG